MESGTGSKADGARRNVVERIEATGYKSWIAIERYDDSRDCRRMTSGSKTNGAMECFSLRTLSFFVITEGNQAEPDVETSVET